MIIETRWWVEHVYLGCVEEDFLLSLYHGKSP